MGIAAAMLLPILLWGALARAAVVEDIAHRDAEQRLLTARLAASAIQSEATEAGRRLDLVASRQGLRSALAARDAVDIERHLADLRRGTVYATALALDASGRLLARDPAAPETYGQGFADRDYYSGALGSQGAYLSEAVVSRITGQTLVVAARAVRDGDRVLGLLLATLTPAQMLDQLRPLHATSGRELHLVDQQARVIASTDGGRAPLSELRISAGTSAGNGSAAVFDAAEKLVTYTPVEATPWTLVVSDEASVALAGQRRLDQQLAAGAAVTVGLALTAAAGIAYLFATVTRQRRDLADREAALERTNVELESASRHKSEFLAGMSHELRTPLNAILGFSDLVGEQLASVTSERQKRYLRNIRDAGEHLLSLINDVLDLSKVEAGRIELRPDDTTLADLCEPVVASTRAAAEARGVAFAAAFVDEGARVSVDAGRVRQILYNLLSNAVKFTPPGGEVRLTVGTAERDLRVTVEDTGMGIPEDKRERVFGTFERLHEGRSDAPGTGLGLALTKRLVDLHHGRIAFESEEGRGTTFTVVFPDVVAEASAPHRVLVVEDDHRDAELIVALAGGAGLATEVVGSVAGAVAAIRRSTPIAIVLDQRLPDGRGERVLELIRGEAGARRIPAIVVTVEDDEGSSRGLGADDHLTKPIDRKRLGVWLQHVATRDRVQEVPLARAAGG